MEGTGKKRMRKLKKSERLDGKEPEKRPRPDVKRRWMKIAWADDSTSGRRTASDRKKGFPLSKG